MGYYELIRVAAQIDVALGDFVVLERVNLGFLTYEKILTFNGITIENMRPTYACYAKTQEIDEDCNSYYED